MRGVSKTNGMHHLHGVQVTRVVEYCRGEGSVGVDNGADAE